MQYYDVTFREIGPERLGMLLAAAHAPPAVGKVPFADPEIAIVPMTKRIQVHDEGVDFTVIVPVSVTETVAMDKFRCTIEKVRGGGSGALCEAIRDVLDEEIGDKETLRRICDILHAEETRLLKK